ncbi:MAG: nicotinate phosphoribosyltransferase [Deltaproteobacteria bacterium]|nr:nicotinate phosphoribosyltransferase [Deltaproteobacteria bacterium]MBW2070463.1 nicotinate phosphoribosyltransferase [Deltaproteobacteria bacterium]
MRGRAIMTDLYELTMAASYFAQDMFAPATFSLYVRSYPPNRSYFVCAGLHELLDYLESFYFHEDDLEYLEQTSLFRSDFLQYLEKLRFTGEVRAIPEGRIFFCNEPLLEITAPVIQAQLVETYVINTMNFASLIATKASRCVHAADDRRLVDFSLRRTQGMDAGLKAARSSYIGGFLGTSNVQAGKIYDLPIYGTMAHSYVESFDREIDAFRAFAKSFPDNTILLIDTYDTLAGARKAVKVAEEMRAAGKALRAVRLDSGDMVQLSRQVRKILDDAGFPEVKIFASGGFDEFKIQEILAAGACIDAFGVGTKLGVSADAPYLDAAYKMVQYNGRPVLKLSSGKVSLAGPKQVFRQYDEHGMFRSDLIGLRDEDVADADALLVVAMQQGKRLLPNEPTNQIQQRFRQEFAQLPDIYKSLQGTRNYPVGITAKLQALQDQVQLKIHQQELAKPL